MDGSIEARRTVRVGSSSRRHTTSSSPQGDCDEGGLIHGVTPTHPEMRSPPPGTPRRPILRRRRRRKLKVRVYVLGIVLLVAAVHYSDMLSWFSVTDYSWNDESNTTTTTNSSNNSNHNSTESAGRQDVLKDPQGAPIVVRNSSMLFDFLASPEPGGMTSPTTTTDSSSPTIETVRQDRGPILKILKDAGVTLTSSDRELLTLPSWTKVQELYGSEPVLVGLDTCHTFQTTVGSQSPTRFVGVSGIFNSGTTAFGISLQANCRFPHHPQNMTNKVLSDSNGMLSQVPWAKHKMATEKDSHTIHEDIPKENVLPIILVRDPFFWMQSMCKQGYGVRWPHDRQLHCPNLVPNKADRRRFKKELHNATSVSVWMGKDPHVGPSWPSLVHYYNAWYQSYVQADFPRLMIRFEDTLFHGEAVMKQVCECAGGEPVSDKFLYSLEEAKSSHKHEQNNFVSAMIHYGTDEGRYHNMTPEDLDFARDHLDPALLDLFHYQKP